MKEKELTSVDWLVGIMRQRQEQGLSTSLDDLEMFAEQAKEMEKEQQMKTYKVALMRGMSYDEDVYHENKWRDPEKYYNETFKSE
jgi:hypothetical protein